MRIFILCLLCIAPVLAASCTSQCKRWVSDTVTATGSFVPCELGLNQVSIVAGLTTYTQSGVSTPECGPSGSGVQLSITVPVGGGNTALFSWMYADSDSALICDQLLRSATTDDSLDLLGFSIALPSGIVQSWPDLLISDSDCPVAQALAVTPLSTPRCYSNEAEPTVLNGTTSPWMTHTLLWKFSTKWDGTVQNVSMLLDGTPLNVSGAKFYCNHNAGTTIFQVYDSYFSRWTIGWNYNTYASCDDFMQSMIDRTDDIPIREIDIVIVPAEQSYIWIRSVTYLQTPARLGDREVACLPSPSPTPTPSPSPSPLPIGSPGPMLPVVPFVQCASRSEDGPCRAWFGYSNPNAVAVRLVPGTAANQLLVVSLNQPTTVPEFLQPGIHNYSFSVDFPCNRNGYPSAAWKLRTSVPVSVAEQLEGSGCVEACRHDTLYYVLECSGLVSTNGHVPGVVNATVPVMMCARTQLGSVPTCE